MKSRMYCILTVLSILNIKIFLIMTIFFMKQNQKTHGHYSSVIEFIIHKKIETMN